MRNIVVILFLVLIALTSRAQSDGTRFFEIWSTKKANKNLVLAPTGTGSVTSAFDFLWTGTGQIQIPSGTTAQRSGSPAAGMFRFNSTLTQFEGYDGTAWGEIGGGSGGGLDVFHTDDFEGASVSFTCGTNLTAADETTDNISGDTSKKFTQGSTPPALGIECVSPSITLDKKQIGTLIGVTFVATSDHNDDEIDFVVYDEDDAEMVRIPIKASTVPKTYEGFFETLSTSTSLRYELEVQTQNADAVAIIDDVEFKTSPLAKTQIYASSEWEAFTPTGSWTTNTTYTGFKRRVGDSLEVDALVSLSGAPDSATLVINLPSGLSIDTSKKSITTNNSDFLGEGTVVDFGSATYRTTVTYNDSTSVAMRIQEISTTYVQDNNLNQSNPHVFAAGDTVQVNFKVPIAGWSDTKNGVVVKGKISSDVSSANTFSFDINTGTTITNETFESLIVSAVENSTSSTERIVTFTFGSGIFTGIPKITANTTGPNSQLNQVSITSRSSSSFTASIPNSSGVKQSATFKIERGTDYVKESDRTIVFPEGLYAPTCYVSDQKSVNVEGGTATSGSWLQRDLNATSGSCNFLSLSSNDITIQSGSYNIECSSPFNSTVNSAKIRLRNTTDGTTAVVGSSVRSGAADSHTTSTLKGFRSFSEAKTLELQYQVQTTRATDGLGNAANFAENEVYSQCKITKVN